MSIDDKLFKVKYVCDSVSHLTNDDEKCKNWNYPKGNKGVTFKQG